MGVSVIFRLVIDVGEYYLAVMYVGIPYDL